jgi:hypothetical protein
MRRSCCPPKVHISTGRLCSLGSECLPFPEVNAPIRPSDSLHCFAPELRFPSLGPTSTRISLVSDRQGLPDDWSTLLNTRRSRTPRRLHYPLDLSCGGNTAAFQHHETLGTGMKEITGLHSHGSHSRVPTYRRRGYPRRRKARFRPAGLRFGRAGFAPAGWILQISGRTEHVLPFRPAFPGHFHDWSSLRLFIDFSA